MSIVVSLCASACARGPQARARGFLEVTTQDVVLHTDLPADRARELAEQTQQTRDVLARGVFQCARETSLPPLHVTALAHPADMRALSTSNLQFDGLFLARAARWLPDEIVVVAVSDSMRPRVVAHEITHQLIGVCYPRMPYWLNEGLAGFYETIGPLVQGRASVGRAAYAFGPNFGFTRRGARELVVLPRDLLPSVSELRAMSYEDFHATRYRGLQHVRMFSEHYGGAWLTAHMFLAGGGPLPGLFQAYLDDLRSEPEDEATLWRRHFAAHDVDAALRAYRQQSRLRHGFVTAPSTPPGHTQVRPMDEAEMHLAWARLLMARGLSEEARIHLDLAVTNGAPPAREALLRGTLVRTLEGLSQGTAHFVRAAEQDPELVAAAHARVVTASPRRGPGFEVAVERLAEIADTPEALADAALALGDLGHASRSIEVATLAVERGPQSWRARAALARAHEANGRIEGALREAETALALAPHQNATELLRLVGLLRRVDAAMNAPPAHTSPRPVTPDGADEAGASRVSRLTAIVDVIRAHAPELRACYEARLAADATLSGRVELRIVLGEDGSPSDVRAQSSTLGDAATEACILGRVRGWSFPPGDQELTFVFPFVFATE